MIMKAIRFLFASILAWTCWLPAGAVSFEKTVAADGTGDYTTIQEAILSCRHFSYEPIYILVKKGTYHEKLEVPSWITDLVLVGEDREETVIIHDDHTGKETEFSLATPLKTIMTFTSYTVKVSGNRTQLHNLTIVNNAPRKGQAVALHIEANGILVRNCRLIGNQDTLYATGEQSEVLMEECYVEGTTDFIFGSAQLFMDRCEIHCKSNSYITAASTPKGREFGFAIFDSSITAEEGIDRVYLGRPWRIYAKTVFIGCRMGDFIRPEGWHNWNKPEAEQTAFYGEYGTVGTGTGERVGWSRQLTGDTASRYRAELARMKTEIPDLLKNH